MKHIGFIGASGLMGHGMASNLLKKGFELSVTVHKRREPLADLLAAGAHEVATPAELGACDAVILCVTGSPQVEAALLGPQGILSHAKLGLVVIDASTSEPESTQRLAALCAEKGVTLVDAPLALVMYLMGTPHRRRARQLKEQQEQQNPTPPQKETL